MPVRLSHFIHNAAAEFKRNIRTANERGLLSARLFISVSFLYTLPTRLHVPLTCQPPSAKKRLLPAQRATETHHCKSLAFFALQ